MIVRWNNNDRVRERDDDEDDEVAADEEEIVSHEWWMEGIPGRTKCVDEAEVECDRRSKRWRRSNRQSSRQRRNANGFLYSQCFNAAAAARWMVGWLVELRRRRMNGRSEESKKRLVSLLQLANPQL